MLQAEAQPLSKKERRRLRKSGMFNQSHSLPMQRIQPLTVNQEIAFDAWRDGQDVFLHGTAGTGKTLMGMYFGLREVLVGNHEKLIIIRSVVPSRDMGFLPGSAKEKSAEFEVPYFGICNTLFNRGDAYNIVKQKGHVEFKTTSHLRGLTLDNAIIMVDECQNMTWQELHTIMTRIGSNTRIIFCGDTKQSDLDERKGKHDLNKMLRVCKNMRSFEFVQMQPEDVVRSGKAKEYILACEALGY